jgi:cytochrome o ubiquinol oxidase subunit 2
VLDQAAYAQLARQSQRVAPLTFGAVDPKLFAAISTQKIAPAPGPVGRQGGREIVAGGTN